MKCDETFHTDKHFDRNLTGTAESADNYHQRYTHWSCPETLLEFAEILIKVIWSEQNVSCELWLRRVHYISNEGNVGRPPLCTLRTEPEICFGLVLRPCKDEQKPFHKVSFQSVWL